MKQKSKNSQVPVPCVRFLLLLQRHHQPDPLQRHEPQVQVLCSKHLILIFRITVVDDTFLTISKVFLLGSIDLMVVRVAQTFDMDRLYTLWWWSEDRRKRDICKCTMLSPYFFIDHTALLIMMAIRWFHHKDASSLCPTNDYRFDCIEYLNLIVLHVVSNQTFAGMHSRPLSAEVEPAPKVVPW